ncbi:MAG: MBL fold metallo-hydrolase [Spirochaetaceae bacterium]|jgi:glyoxylase-like metal-dependent hydrolase (beta-lactamase superfamily II)|nr:MBL fold metallo-hydrolase [Spirochaetaceae bacterium]
MKITVVPSGFLSVNTIFVPLGPKKGDSPQPVMVIDPGDESCADLIQQRGLEPKAVVLTHGHFDHVMGLGALRKAFPPIPIALHPLDGGLFGPGMSARTGRNLRDLGLGRGFAAALGALPEANVPLGEGVNLGSVFKDADPGDEVRQAASLWRVLHTPGHTQGSLCFYTPQERALISGDTMFYGTWGRTDFPESSEADMEKSLRRLLGELPGDTVVYPGHESWGFTLARNPLPV